MQTINQGDRYYIGVGAPLTSKLLVIAAQALPVINYSHEGETVNGEYCATGEIIHEQVTVKVWIPEKRIIEPSVQEKFYNRLGPFGIFYNFGVHTPGWRQISNTDTGLRINKIHDESKPISGIPCRLATVNGDTPFQVYIPIIKP